MLKEKRKFSWQKKYLWNHHHHHHRGMVTYTSNSGTWEAEAGESMWVVSHPEIQWVQSQTILIARSCLTTNKQTNTGKNEEEKMFVLMWNFNFKALGYYTEDTGCILWPSGMLKAVVFLGAWITHYCGPGIKGWGRWLQVYSWKFFLMSSVLRPGGRGRARGSEVST